MKSEQCKDCPLYNRPGPVKSFFTGFDVDVAFVFISPGYAAPNECLHEPLKSSVERIGLTSYGVVDAWKCVLEGSLDTTSNGERHVHPHCMKILKAELICHQPKILVTLGTAAMEALTYYPYNVYKHPGKFGIAERLDSFTMMPMIYPSKAGKYPDVWNEGFDELNKFLGGSMDNNNQKKCKDCGKPINQDDCREEKFVQERVKRFGWCQACIDKNFGR